jgi:hypothetical protein
MNDFNSRMADQVRRAWHPNCALTGTSGVRIRVRVQLARDGSVTLNELADYPSLKALEGDPVKYPAAARAIEAVAASSPFRNVPPVEVYDQWKSRIVAFDGKDACG